MIGRDCNACSRARVSDDRLETLTASRASDLSRMRERHRSTQRRGAAERLEAATATTTSASLRRCVKDTLLRERHRFDAEAPNRRDTALPQASGLVCRNRLRCESQRRGQAEFIDNPIDSKHQLLDMEIDE